MPPTKIPLSEKYFINIICDFTLVTQFERLQLPSPQTLHQQHVVITDNGTTANNNNNNNNNTQQHQPHQNYLCALCEDVGMERAAVIGVTTGKPYIQESNLVMNNNNNHKGTASSASNNNQQQQRQELEVVCAVITLPQETVRLLYTQGNLVNFLKDGLAAIQNKYNNNRDENKNNNKNTDSSSSQSPATQQTKNIITKAFLVIEVPKRNPNFVSNNNTQDNNNKDREFLDQGIMSELLIFQNASEGSGVITHCTFVTTSPPPAGGASSSSSSNLMMMNNSNHNNTTASSSSSRQIKDEVSSYIQALGIYLARKAISTSTSSSDTINTDEINSNNKNSSAASLSFRNFNAKIRDRDDTFTLFEPQFLTRGKIDTADWAAAYRGFLCEIEGITQQKAVSIISKFPSLKSLLDAIARKDQRSMAILADSVGASGKRGNNSRVGDALVQKIIDKMTTKFDEKIALSSNARSFV